MNYAKQFLVGLLIIGMLVLPVRSEAQQSQQASPIPQLPKCYVDCPPPPPPPPPVSPAITVPTGVSLAVVQQTQKIAITVQGHVNINSVTSSDIVAISTALQSQFANWKEATFTDMLQSWILANQVLYTTAVPTSAQLQAGYNSLVANTGIAVSYTQYESAILGQPLTTRETFISIVNRSGLHYLHDKILAELGVYATYVKDNGQTDPSLQRASYHQYGRVKNICFTSSAEVPDDGNDDGEDALTISPAGQIVPVGFNYILTATGASPPWISIAGLYLTIVALAVSGPVGWAIGAAGATMTGVGLMGGC